MPTYTFIIHWLIKSLSKFKLVSLMAELLKIPHGIIIVHGAVGNSLFYLIFPQIPLRIVSLKQDPINTETSRHFEMAWYDFCSTAEEQRLSWGMVPILWMSEHLTHIHSKRNVIGEQVLGERVSFVLRYTDKWPLKFRHVSDECTDSETDPWTFSR